MTALWSKTKVVSLVIAIVSNLLLTQSSLTVEPHTVSAQGAGTRIFLPLILKYPPVAKSHYMYIAASGFDAYTAGQADAQEHQLHLARASGTRFTFVLAWGQTCKYSSNPLTWGAYAYDANNNCHAVSEIQTKVQQYIDGYCAKMQSIRPGTSGQNCGYRYNLTAIPIVIAIGVDNCVGGTGCSNPPNDPSNAVTYGHGQFWGDLIDALDTYAVNHGYGYQIWIVGAMDIEGAWNTYTNTKSWLDGYKAVSSRPFYDYGDCNCPEGYSPSNNDHIGPPLFQRDWSYNRIHEVSNRGIPLKYPLPQIYHTTGSGARKWQGLSKWAFVNGYGKIIFGELLTTYGTCLQGANCTGIDNTPQMALTQMLQALNADPDTAGGLAINIRSTDINRYP